MTQYPQYDHSSVPYIVFCGRHPFVESVRHVSLVRFDFWLIQLPHAVHTCGVLPPFSRMV